jgi:hypothetical protein
MMFNGDCPVPSAPYDAYDRIIELLEQILERLPQAKTYERSTAKTYKLGPIAAGSLTGDYVSPPVTSTCACGTNTTCQCGVAE